MQNNHRIKVFVFLLFFIPHSLISMEDHLLDNEDLLFFEEQDIDEADTFIQSHKHKKACLKCIKTHMQNRICRYVGCIGFFCFVTTIGLAIYSDEQRRDFNHFGFTNETLQ